MAKDIAAELAALGLTEEERSLYREAFDAFDDDKGGTIENSEIKKVMQRLGQHPTDEEIAIIVKEYDTDNVSRRRV